MWTRFVQWVITQENDLFRTHTADFPSTDVRESKLKSFSMLRQPRILLHKSSQTKTTFFHQQQCQLMSPTTTHHRQMLSWIVLRRRSPPFQQAWTSS
ncbi:hypothetical protein AVEN_39787-1 [Araneus ventricosus]|uniref:Uncharacterized protein n=1 Tax=Araneus ventricosus TaxID=182803 RepID=A0A4Y2I6I8_ARAVE|nr:hypothetical protein AVEN_39787-1 [Araneus ventricosus]